MKRIKKVCIMLLIAIICVAFLQSNILAKTTGEWIKDMVDTTGDSALSETATNISGTVMTITKVACAGVAVIMLVLFVSGLILTVLAFTDTKRKHKQKKLRQKNQK